VSADRDVVDSSGWIEVFKWVLREHTEAQAIQAAAVMQRGLVVDLDSRLAHARTHFQAVHNVQPENDS
jgi:hypothetical protein